MEKLYHALSYEFRRGSVRTGHPASWELKKKALKISKHFVTNKDKRGKLLKKDLSKMMKNKKGAETAISTIVIVILAVLVLIIVIAGFTMGWKNLWEKINIFAPAAESIDAVVAKCDTLCLANQKYSYCCDKQKVKNIGELSCIDLKEIENLPITCESITQDYCDTEVACR